MKECLCAFILLAASGVAAFAGDRPEFGCKQSETADYEAIVKETDGMNCQSNEYNTAQCMARDLYARKLHSPTQIERFLKP